MITYVHHYTIQITNKITTAKTPEDRRHINHQEKEVYPHGHNYF